VYRVSDAISGLSVKVEQQARKTARRQPLAQVAAIQPVTRMRMPATTLNPSLTSNTFAANKALPVIVAALLRFIAWLTFGAFCLVRKRVAR
jgi:hypothetical protein